MARRAEQSGGFAIGTYSEDIVEANAEERFSVLRHHTITRAASESYEMQKAGLVDAKGQITKEGWEVLNDDISRLERNSLVWLRKNFPSGLTDWGHDSSGDLVGTFWFDDEDLGQAELVLLGVNERIDMSDSTYGDLSLSVWKGVSSFGESVLGGAINFYDVDKDVLERMEDRLDEVRRRARRAKR